MVKNKIKIIPLKNIKKSITEYPVKCISEEAYDAAFPLETSPNILENVATKFLENPCRKSLKCFTLSPVSFIFCFFISLSSFAKDSNKIRRVPVQGDQIVTVKTSIGIATIIQVPDRPNSVVVGDQDSFKVEYLDQAITIKPLTGGAKSNLYIYTDWKRFNVELVSGAEASADYVVYLEMPKDKPLATQTKDFGVRWTEFKNQLRNDNLSLNIKRVGRSKNGILLIEFNVSSTKKEAFKPEWIWLTQMGETQPIHNLFMSSLELSPQKTISGVLQLREVDLNTNETFRIEIRRNKVSYLTVQKVATWKR